MASCYPANPRNRALRDFRALLLAKNQISFDRPARRRGGRVVYRASLENWSRCKLTVGSNPTPSATFFS